MVSKMQICIIIQDHIVWLQRADSLADTYLVLMEMLFKPC